MDIVLASHSPRRAELLKKITGNFTVNPSCVNEEKIKEKSPLKFALKAAVLKAKDTAINFPHSIVIGADTIVVLGREVLGKPKSRAHARRMLMALSGRKHKVITGLAFYKKDEERLLSGYEATKVIFNKISPADIENYLDDEDYADKAGSYAIQSGACGKFIKGIEGDYDNVVGFPVKKARIMIERFCRKDFKSEL